MASDTNGIIHWERLPPLPDAKGFAGSFAGLHSGALLVAGGANFPTKPPWEGGAKVWYDSVFVLEQPNGDWKAGFRLPHPLAYGVSLTHRQGVICIGGSNAEGHRRDVFVMRWEQGDVQITRLEGLPRPCANMCGALVGDLAYVAGGLETADATQALRGFWAMDLAQPNPAWRELEPWPGPGRMFAVAGVQGSAFFLFGGAELKTGADGKPVRRWLREAYRYDPNKGWKRLADLPRVAVAAPSPAPALENGSLLVLGGDDGAQIDADPAAHRGFPRGVLGYRPETDTWRAAGSVPFSLVTTPCVNWRGRIIVPGGEARPGVRSPQVWAGSHTDSGE